jgi:hypothetical protein
MTRRVARDKFKSTTLGNEKHNARDVYPLLFTTPAAQSRSDSAQFGTWLEGENEKKLDVSLKAARTKSSEP